MLGVLLEDNLKNLHDQNAFDIFHTVLFDNIESPDECGLVGGTQTSDTVALKFHFTHF